MAQSTVIKAVHFAELRGAIKQQTRVTRVGTVCLDGPHTHAWEHTRVRLVHLTELLTVPPSQATRQPAVNAL
jgi:hypothetical protein